MKISITWVLAILGLMLPDTIFAQSSTVKAEVDGIYYQFDNATMTCKPCQRKAKNTTVVNIPESVTYNEQSYTVTAIGASAFQRWTAMESLTLPSTVSEIEPNAFRECYSLKSIVIPEGVEVVGESAFYECEKATSLSLPSTLRQIGESAFDGVKLNGQTLTIPANVTEIGQEAFSDCEPRLLIIEGTSGTFGSNAFYSLTGNMSVISYIEEPSGDPFTFVKAIYVPETLYSTYKNSVWAESHRSIEKLESLSKVNISEGQYGFAGRASNPIKCSYIPGKPACGIQFDMFLPEELTLVDNSITLAPGLTNHLLNYNIDGDAVKIIIYSPSAQDIPDNLDYLFSFNADIDVNRPAGNYPIPIKNIVETDAQANGMIAPPTTTGYRIDRKPLQITLASDKSEIYVFEKTSITPSFYPEDTSAELIWLSSDEKVATVDAQGNISGLAPGNVTITATANDEIGAVGSIDFTVVYAPTDRIEAEQSFTCHLGDGNLDLTANVFPAGANPILAWETNSPTASIESISTGGVENGHSISKTSVSFTEHGNFIVTAIATDNSDVRTNINVKVLPMIGDADGDNEITVADITLTARAAINDVDGSMYLECVDLNNDGTIDVLDVALLAQAALDYESSHQQPSNAPSRVRRSAQETPCLQMKWENTNELVVTIDNASKYAALQFDVDLPEGYEIENAQLNGTHVNTHSILTKTLSSGKYRVIVHSLASFNEADNGILRIIFKPADGSTSETPVLTNVKASNAQGQLFTMPNVNAPARQDITTGISDNSADNAQPTYYNLQGLKIDNPKPGTVVIVVREGYSQKIIFQ